MVGCDHRGYDAAERVADQRSRFPHYLPQPRHDVTGVVGKPVSAVNPPGLAVTAEIGREYVAFAGELRENCGPVLASGTKAMNEHHRRPVVRPLVEHDGGFRRVEGTRREFRRHGVHRKGGLTPAPNCAAIFLLRTLASKAGSGAALRDRLRSPRRRPGPPARGRSGCRPSTAGSHGPARSPRPRALTSGTPSDSERRPL